MVGRPGDHLFCPFECDLCSFFRLKGRRPDKTLPADALLLTFMRRANLDAFWSRAPDTIKGLRSVFWEQVEVGEAFDFQMFGPMGPFSSTYDSGIRAALGVLWRSQKPGRHEAKQKFSSVRKARSVHTDVYRASAKGAEGTIVWRSEKQRFVATEAPSDSEWFSAFMAGFRSRVGERRKQDAAIPIEVMCEVQKIFEEDWAMAQDQPLDCKRGIAEAAVFMIIGYAASLRGFELPKTVLTDLRKQIFLTGDPEQPNLAPHIGWPLRGRFKARSRAVQELLVFVAAETASGLKPGLWTQRLVDILAQMDIRDGWLFQDDYGDAKPMMSFAPQFYEKLLQVQERKPTLFPEGLDIMKDCHLARSLRRGATTRATNAGVSGSDIDWVNRWNTGGEELSSGPMRVTYADRRQLLETYLRFSLAL